MQDVDDPRGEDVATTAVLRDTVCSGISFAHFPPFAAVISRCKHQEEHAMRAVCWCGAKKVRVENVPDPTILAPPDFSWRLVSHDNQRPSK
jgi:hypothetical protein